MSQIKQIKVSGVTYDVGQFTPTFAALFSMSGDSSNNLTIGKYATSNGTVKHINLEAGVVTEGGTTKRGDILLKPCDDIAFYSHHREAGSQDKVHLTAMLSYTSGSNNIDTPVELILNCANLTLSSKNKDLTKVYSNISSKLGAKDESESDVFNVFVKKSVSSTPNGYLKVRAKAIDLRCEDTGGGGIALQPKGFDSEGNHNKVKFEHGGGDGLEFFTMNDEKMSAFTDEYRFKKGGIWYMATRTKIDSDKAAANDSTTAYKYQKASDDFYDNIDAEDPYADTEAIIKTANALNMGKDRHTKKTSSGHIEIQTEDTYQWVVTNAPEDESTAVVLTSTDNECVKTNTDGDLDTTEIYNEGDFDGDIYDTTAVYTFNSKYYTWTKVDSPNIKLISGGDIDIEATGTLTLKGTTDFGSTLDFGELEGDSDSTAGLRFDHKYTKKLKTKACDIIGINVINNSTNTYNWTGIESTPACPTSVAVAAGESKVVASCSVYDIIKLVNYMKSNNQGPWAA